LADVPQLAEFFLERACERNNLPGKILSDAALRNLMNRSFAGNVRELENIVERAAISSGNSSLILPEYFSGAAEENVEKKRAFSGFSQSSV
jgi:DNA-binding NtrC family response regulator